MDVRVYIEETNTARRSTLRESRTDNMKMKSFIRIKIYRDLLQRDKENFYFSFLFETFIIGEQSQNENTNSTDKSFFHLFQSPAVIMMKCGNGPTRHAHRALSSEFKKYDD